VTFWGTGGLEELRVALGGCRWLQAAAGGLGGHRLPCGHKGANGRNRYLNFMMSVTFKGNDSEHEKVKKLRISLSF
jgi:hypothetical protein